MGQEQSKTGYDGPKPYFRLPDGHHVQPTTSYIHLYYGIKSLLEKSKYSDLIVICGQEKYYVHRAIVCTRSTWFEQVCDAQDPNATLPLTVHCPSDEHPEIISAVLNYLYTNDYKDTGSQLVSRQPLRAEAPPYSGEPDTPITVEKGPLESPDNILTPTSSVSVATPNDEAPPRYSFTEETRPPLPVSEKSGLQEESSPPMTCKPKKQGSRLSRIMRKPVLSPPLPALLPTPTPAPRMIAVLPVHESQPQPHPPLQAQEPGQVQEPRQLGFHALMSSAGQFYGIPPLSQVAKEKFKARIENPGIIKSEGEVLDAIRCVYSMPLMPEGEGDVAAGAAGAGAGAGAGGGLRELILKDCRLRFATLKGSEGFGEVVKEFPEFAGDLLKGAIFVG